MEEAAPKILTMGEIYDLATSLCNRGYIQWTAKREYKLDWNTSAIMG